MLQVEAGAQMLEVFDTNVGCLTPGSNEGFSNAVVEQMAVGLPMIVTDVGGNAEAVVDGENGRVIPPQDATSFSSALIDLHGNPARAAVMGRASRTRVEERFSLERMCAEHVRLYRSLCASWRLASGSSAGGRSPRSARTTASGLPSCRAARSMRTVS